MLIVEQQSRAPDAAQHDVMRCKAGAHASASARLPGSRLCAATLARCVASGTREDDVVTSHSVIARSPCDEAIQTASVAGFWIASAFAKASADKSLRSPPQPFSTNEACNKAVIQRN